MASTAQARERWLPPWRRDSPAEVGGSQIRSPMSAIPSTLVVHSDSPKIYLMPGDLEEAELDQGESALLKVATLCSAVTAGGEIRATSFMLGGGGHPLYFTLFIIYACWNFFPNLTIGLFYLLSALFTEIDRPNGVEGLSIRYWREEDRTRPRPKWSARLRSLPGIWATEFRGSSWRLGWEVQLPREGKRENATKILMSGRSDFFSCLEVPTLR